jgi:Ca2+-transporting ATPase
MIISGLIQGLGILAVIAGVFYYLLSSGYGEGVARMVGFASLVIGNLGLIFANRYTTRSILATLKIPNVALWWVTGGAIAFLVLVLEVPFLRELFKFADLKNWEIVLIAITGLISILLAESTKLKFVQRLISTDKAG